MKLGDICSAPCFANAAQFDIPPRGCKRNELKFEHDGRDYYAVLLKNHDIFSTATLSPRLAVVGLSPARNQIDKFVDVYEATGDYFAASVGGAFAGLAGNIIAMIKGLGIADKLGLHFPDPLSLAWHPDIFVTSLIACASLAPDGSSDDFDPNQYEGARRCMTERFVGEMLNPALSRLSHVLILGAKGWSAVQTTLTSNNTTVMEELRNGGKIVLNLPHPSDQNLELVKLASLSNELAPPLDEYVSKRWMEYEAEPPKRNKKKQSEKTYKKRRAAIWQSVDLLRRQIA